MKIEVVEEGQIYRNKRNHLVLRNGRHICYIDIPQEAIVYTTLDRIRTEDWELYLSPGDGIKADLPIKEWEEPTIKMEDIKAHIKKKRGRPKKVSAE